MFVIDIPELICNTFLLIRMNNNESWKQIKKTQRNLDWELFDWTQKSPFYQSNRTRTHFPHTQVPRSPPLFLYHVITPSLLSAATGHCREQRAPYQGVPGSPPEQDQPQEPSQIRRGFPQVSREVVVPRVVGFRAWVHFCTKTEEDGLGVLLIWGLAFFCFFFFRGRGLRLSCRMEFLCKIHIAPF